MDGAGRVPACSCPSASGRRGSTRIVSGGWLRRCRLAMADAAEDDAGLAAGHDPSEWPNDLVVASDDGGAVRKLGGVLGETDGLGTADPRASSGSG